MLLCLWCIWVFQHCPCVCILRADICGVILLRRLHLDECAVTGDAIIMELIFFLVYTIADIAFNGEDRGVLQTFNQTNMVSLSIVFPVEEDKIAGLGDVIGRHSVKTLFGQCLYPAGAVGDQRYVLYTGVIQTESDKHGIPIIIGVAVPCAVAGVALLLFVFGYNVVFGAFSIAQLAFGDGQHIGCPYTGQLCRQGRFPIFSCFHIRIGIGVAA